MIIYKLIYMCSTFFLFRNGHKEGYSSFTDIVKNYLYSDALLELTMVTRK